MEDKFSIFVDGKRINATSLTFKEAYNQVSVLVNDESKDIYIETWEDENE